MSSLLERCARPSTWQHGDSNDIHLVDLSASSSEFRTVKSKMGSINPRRIVRVENPYLWASYQLTVQEYRVRRGAVDEVQLWHATNSTSAESIAQDNFNWRLTNRAKFGKGVCFAPTADYAHEHSTRDGALILTRVLLGKTSGGGSFSTTIPPPGYDTTTGKYRGDLVYVKYTDNTFYPEYVAYYY